MLEAAEAASCTPGEFLALPKSEQTFIREAVSARNREKRQNMPNQ